MTTEKNVDTPSHVSFEPNTDDELREMYRLLLDATRHRAWLLSVATGARKTTRVVVGVSERGDLALYREQLITDRLGAASWRPEDASTLEIHATSVDEMVIGVEQRALIAWLSASWMAVHQMVEGGATGVTVPRP